MGRTSRSSVSGYSAGPGDGRIQTVAAARQEVAAALKTTKQGVFQAAVDEATCKQPRAEDSPKPGIACELVERLMAHTRRHMELRAEMDVALHKLFKRRR